MIAPRDFKAVEDGLENPVPVTNLALYSHDLTNNYWNMTNCTRSDSGILSPLGVNWTKLEVAATIGSHAWYKVLFGAGRAKGVTFSLLMRKGSPDGALGMVAIHNATANLTLRGGSLNFDTGVIATTFSAVPGSESATALGEQAYLVRVTALGGMADGDTIQIYPGNTGSARQAGEFVYVIGVQLEEGGVANPVVKTTNEPATFWPSGKGDLLFDGGDLILDAGESALKDELRTRLLLQRGEWFLDERAGVPWRELVFVKNPNLAAIRAVLSEAILASPGVAELVDLKLEPDNRTRTLYVSWAVRGDLGQLVSDSVEV